ncbi:MAG TPA: hypothetical protein VMU34_17405 [Mycobacterium sp.]|nr:hypothetical protein [Mycobacterium sp.]
MNVVLLPVRVLVRIGDVMATVGGAAGSAAVHGVVGGAVATVTGIREGLTRSQPRSASQAALTVLGICTVGLLQWPVIMTIGSTGLVVRALPELSSRLKRASPRRCSPPHRRDREIMPPDNRSG